MRSIAQRGAVDNSLNFWLGYVFVDLGIIGMCSDAMPPKALDE